MQHNNLAARCFNENKNRFGNPQTSPEKFNLYNGLEHMAIMIENLLSRVGNLESQIQSLQQKVSQYR